MSDQNIELNIIRSREFRSLDRTEKNAFLEKYKSKYLTIPEAIRNKWWNQDKNRGLVNKINQYSNEKGAFDEEQSDEDIIVEKPLTLEEKILKNQILLIKL